MASKQIDKILDLKMRGEFSFRVNKEQRFSSLDNLINKRSNFVNIDTNKELLRHICISSVTCIEAYFRSVYKYLIDFGSPFRENLANLSKPFKKQIDIETLIAIDRDEFTLGELVSHSLSNNNIEAIDMNLSAICGLKFLDELKVFRPKTISEDKTKDLEYFEKNYNSILRDISDITRLRNIFCHEYGNRIELNESDALRSYQHIKMFLTQVDYFIWYTVEPNMPETQSEINLNESKKFNDAENRLNNLIKYLLNTEDVNGEYGLNKDLLKKTMKKWREYRSSIAELDSFPVKDGSLFNLFYYGSLSRITQLKIDYLKSRYDIQGKI